MKYRGYTIEKSGFNYRVRNERGNYIEGVAANIQTAKKWIDAELLTSWVRERTRAFQCNCKP